MIDATVTRHPAVGDLTHAPRAIDQPGSERATGLQPGDYILVHSHGKLAPRLIGFGQKLHHDPAFAYWTHAAVYVGTPRIDDTPSLWHPGKNWLIEAKGGKKVRYVPLEQYDVRDYAAVRFGDSATPEMRANARRFAESRIGEGYDYSTIFTLSAWALFGGKFSFGMNAHEICSGLVAQTTMYEGEIYPGDATEEMPADLAEKRNIRR